MIHTEKPIDALLVRKVNRFLCLVKINGGVEEASVPSSGRLTELMTPGRRVLVEAASSPNRKTGYTLRAAWRNGRWVLVDSTAPNRLVAELVESGGFRLFPGYTKARREYSIGAHRFDLLLEGKGAPPVIVEIKSVTLVEDKVARFPDAPTERGRRHVLELARLNGKGLKSAVLFVIQRSDAACFRPNWRTDPAFGGALREAVESGVEVAAVRLRVGRRMASVMGSVPVLLQRESSL